MTKPLIFLDTETTGLKNPRLLELAYLQQDDTAKAVSLRCKPAARIEIGAMMVHHITENDVAMLQLFKDMPAYDEIKNTIENGIVVAHHAPYDIGVLEREGIHVKEYLCTKEMAQSYFPNAEMHKLQYLRYFLELPIEKAEAHTAGGDIVVLRALWERMTRGFEESAIAKFKRSVCLPTPMQSPVLVRS